MHNIRLHARVSSFFVATYFKSQLPHGGCGGGKSEKEDDGRRRGRRTRDETCGSLSRCRETHCSLAHERARAHVVEEIAKFPAGLLRTTCQFRNTATPLSSSVCLRFSQFLYVSSVVAPRTEILTAARSSRRLLRSPSYFSREALEYDHSDDNNNNKSGLEFEWFPRLKSATRILLSRRIHWRPAW